MGDIFKDILSNGNDSKSKYLGEDYPYYKYIKTPDQLGMSSKGTLKQLGKDVDGLMEYVNVLVSGKSKASATGKPLGNKFFLKTGAKCTNKMSGEEMERYIYINNVPMGNIPLISSGMGANFSEFKGLIPGTISNLNAFNPMSMLQAFVEGARPDCQEITMETIDSKNAVSTETHYVATIDIQNMDPCSFSDRKNPITKQKCKETFGNMNSNDDNFLSNIRLNFDVPDDPIAQLFFATFGIFGIYLFYKILLKYKIVPKLKIKQLKGLKNIKFTR